MKLSEFMLMLCVVALATMVVLNVNTIKKYQEANNNLVAQLMSKELRDLEKYGKEHVCVGKIGGVK